MNHKEKQDDDIMSLEKKEGKETWEMRHETRFNCMEIYP